MSDSPVSDLHISDDQLRQDILSHYEDRNEADRLRAGVGQLELARTQELIKRFIKPPPAVVLDVGGGPGIYSCWLAGLGYEVYLIDTVPLHVEQARKASDEQPDHAVTGFTVGDARKLARQDASVDAVLMLGPLYHLVERKERIAALAEARRVLRPGGVMFAAVISRFASVLDGLFRGLMDDPAFMPIVERDLAEGQHRNTAGHPAYFTTAYLHHPDEPKREAEEAGLVHLATLAIEGPGWLLHNFEEHWQDQGRRERLLFALRSLENEKSMLGASAHILSIARKDS